MPDDKPTLSRMRVVGYLAIVLGLSLIAVGLMWGQIVSPESIWTEEDAREHTEAFEAAHTASIGHGHAHDGSSDHEDLEGADLEAAKARLAASKKKLQRARAIRDHLGKVFSIAGMVVSFLGTLLVRRHPAKHD
ncbi:MAG: hypothetical protein ACR2NU_03015 [Aeoliella sp.]